MYVGGNRWVVIGALLLAASIGLGQTFGPKAPFRLSVDVSRFRGGEDSLVSVELAYSFARQSLTYRADSSGYSGGADITMFIRKADSLVYADRWIVPYVLQDTSAITGGLSLVGNYKMHLPSGEYIFKVLGRDRQETQRMDSVLLRVPIQPFTTGKPVLSDVQFASIVRQGTEGSPFFKNTLEVIPNVGGLYSDDQECYLYAEAYNLLATADTGKYNVRVNVFDAVGRELTSRDRSRRRIAESTVLVDHFGVSNLRTGTYTVVLSLVDSANTVFASAGRKFFVLNRNLGVDSTMLTATTGLPLPEYSSMDETELDREFQWARWDASGSDRDQYELLKGIDAKKRFLTDFWRRRGPGYREEYLARVAYSNANFRALNREGYRSDRGRVHIIYGVPDEIERHPNETDTRPYEIWYFHSIQGGVQFVFVQKSVGGDYELVHSTHRNELHNESWMLEASAR